MGLENLAAGDLALVFLSGHGSGYAALNERKVQAGAAVRDCRNQSSLCILFDAWEVCMGVNTGELAH